MKNLIDYDEEEENLEAAPYDVAKLKKLPTMADPKVFAVKCWEGSEKEAVITLLNKFCLHSDKVLI